jgi:aminopeptidase N
MRLLVGLAQGANDLDADMAALASALLAFVEQDAESDPAFAALVLALPSEADIAQEIGRDVDPDAVHHARTTMRRRIGERLQDRLTGLRERLSISGAYSPDAASAGRRSLRNVALDWIAAADPALGTQLAEEQFASATNMTDRIAAFATLTHLPGEARERAIVSFAEHYRDEPLVLDKWFALQAAIPEAGTLERVKTLMTHPAFAITNPNRVRSLIGSFASTNQTQFHRPDGSGYEFVADTVLHLDRSNPQVASRLLTAFGMWKMVDKPRRERAEKALRRIAENANLSRDVSDIVQRSLT